MRTSKYRKKIDKKKLKIITGALLALIMAGVTAFFVYFHVDTVEVMGSSHYTEDEIKEMVLRGPLAGNSVLAPVLYSKHDTEDIPFVDAVVVSQVNSHTICISVKEKQAVGCVPYLDCYVYFDRQGTVVETAVERDMRTPFFEGVSLENIVINEKLPLENEGILNTSVSLAQIFAKNDDIPDHITLDDNGNIVLEYGSIKAQLGQDRYLEDKMTRLIAILPKISGQAGILHLENVTDTKKIITFEKELTAEEQAAKDQEDASEGSQSGEEDYDSSNDSDYNYDSGYNTDSSYNSGTDSSYSSDYNYDSGENY